MTGRTACTCRRNIWYLLTDMPSPTCCSNVRYLLTDMLAPTCYSISSKTSFLLPVEISHQSSSLLWILQRTVLRLQSVKCDKQFIHTYLYNEILKTLKPVPSSMIISSETYDSFWCRHFGPGLNWKKKKKDVKSDHKVHPRIALAIKTGEAIISVLVPCTACFRRRCAP